MDGDYASPFVAVGGKAYYSGLRGQSQASEPQFTADRR
jgi:hypothetical protein